MESKQTSQFNKHLQRMSNVVQGIMESEKGLKKYKKKSLEKSIKILIDKNIMDKNSKFQIW